MMTGKLQLDCVAQALRSGSSIWRDVKFEYESIQEQEYSNLPNKSVDPSSLRNVLSNTYSHLLERIQGGVNALVEDKFTVEYEIRCNLDRDARYSEECAGMSFDVEWKKKNILVETYLSDSKEVLVSPELRTVLEEGRIRDLNKFAGYTGLNVKDVIDRQSAMSNELVAAFKAYTSGQNKLTRLVKGCLIYIDHLREGTLEYEVPALNVLDYDVKNILKSMNYDDAAFVYNERPGMGAVSAILYAMCQEYPSPIFGGVGHITIPADAKDIYLVGMNVSSRSQKLVISAELIWGVLISYSDRFGLGNELENALAIACTLYENRYLSKVKLPKVQSMVDMVFPALAGSPEGVGDKTLINLDGAKLFGRVHQLLLMVSWKDIDVCAQNSSILRDSSMNRSILALLSRDSHRILEYMEESRLADVLKITHSMRWVEYMTDGDLEMMRNTSVFEGFWLIRYPKNVLKDGIIKCLKKGFKSGISFTQVGLSVDTFKVLRNEVVLGKGPSSFDVPDGAYNVSAVGLMKKQKKAKKREFSNKGRRPDVGYSGGVMVGSAKGPGLLPCREPSASCSQPRSFGWSDRTSPKGGDGRGVQFSSPPREERKDGTADPGPRMFGTKMKEGSKLGEEFKFEANNVRGEAEEVKSIVANEGSRQEKPATKPEAERSDGMVFEQTGKGTYKGFIPGMKAEKKSREIQFGNLPPFSIDGEDEKEKEEERIRLIKKQIEMYGFAVHKSGMLDLGEQLVMNPLFGKAMSWRRGFAIRRPVKEPEIEYTGYLNGLACIVGNSFEEERMRYYATHDVERKPLEDVWEDLREEAEVIEAIRSTARMRASIQNIDDGTTVEYAQKKVYMITDRPHEEMVAERERNKKEPNIKEVMAYTPPRMRREEAEKEMKEISAKINRQVAMRNSADKLRVQGPKYFSDLAGVADLGAVIRGRTGQVLSGIPRPSQVVGSDDPLELWTGDQADYSRRDLTFFNDWFVCKLLTGRFSLSDHVKVFVGILRSAPIGLIRKAKVSFFKDDDEWLSILMTNVQPFKEMEEMPVSAFPKEYQPMYANLRTAMSACYDDDMPIPNDAELARMALEKGDDDIVVRIFRDPVGWKPDDRDKIDTYKDIIGVNKYLVNNDWWRGEYSYVFETAKGSRGGNSREWEWLARYLDEGGDPKYFNAIWKLANNCEFLMKQFPWWEVGEHIHEIARNAGGWLKHTVNKYNSTVQSKNMVGKSTTLQMGEGRDIGYKEYNEHVDEMIEIGVGKRAKLLAQLYVMKRCLVHPSYYAISIKLSNFDSEKWREMVPYLGVWME